MPEFFFPVNKRLEIDSHRPLLKSLHFISCNFLKRPKPFEPSIEDQRGSETLISRNVLFILTITFKTKKHFRSRNDARVCENNSSSDQETTSYFQRFPIVERGSTIYTLPFFNTWGHLNKLLHY